MKLAVETSAKEIKLQRARDRYWENPEKGRERVRIYYQANKPAEKLRAKKYNSTPAGREVARMANAKYRLRNPDKILARDRLYRSTPQGRENRRKASARYRKRHPLRIAARSFAYYYRTVDECVVCGSRESVQRHHYAGYSHENRLKVEGRCRDCHSKEH